MSQDIRAAHIANFILDSADRDEIDDISILKLLKLIYIFFGWVCVFNDKYLFSDDIEAWRYGPVVSSIYYELRGNGRQHIKNRATLYDPFSEEDPLKPTIDNIQDKEIVDTLNIIWSVYKDAPPGHLVALTHQEGTPWWETFDNTPHKVIPKELIEDYYKRFYKKLKNG